MIFSKAVLPLAFSTLFFIAGCNEPVEQSTHSSLPEVEVQVETLTLSTVPVAVELSGTLQALEHATISARVAGQIVKLPVRVGSQVKEGDLLVKISAAEINARVRQAEVLLQQARRNLARESRLLEVNASTSEIVKNLDEQVQSSEAAYREALTMLGYTEIKAPFTGTVTDKLIEVGDLATPGFALLKLQKDSALEVVIQVPEAQSLGLNLASRLPLTVPATGLTLQAQVREISPTVDPASRTTQVKLTLPDAPGLRSGQFARVALPGREATTLLIRSSAVRHNGQMQQVFVAEEGVARLRLVRTGAASDGRFEVLSGLRNGDRVILDPPATLRDGQPLKIMGGNQR